MHKFCVLLGVSLQSMLQTFSFGRGKKRAATGIGALIFIGAIALYLSGIYSFVMADGLRAYHLLHFLIPFMSIIACLMALMLTLFGASSVVYGNRDSDLLLSLPISAFTVMLSKILALYLENFLFCGLWMLPTCAAYAIYAEHVPLSFYLCAVLCIPFLPLIPTLIGVLIGYCIAFCSARLAHKALLSAILSFALFGGVMVAVLQFNKLALLLLTSADTVSHLLQTWLLPFGLLQRGIGKGSLSAALFFCALCLIPFLLIVYALSTQYKHILSSLASRTLRNDYKLTRGTARGQFPALLRKEIGRYFGTSIYFFNTGFGLILLLGSAVYLCFARRSALDFIALLGFDAQNFVVPVLCAALCLFLSTANTTCVSISLEGKTLWILKEAPVSPAAFFGAKAMLNIALAWSVTLLCVIMVTVALSLSLFDVLLVLLLCTALIIHTALFGLVVNLLLPKMDATSDTLIVKQSASAFCGMFGGMALVGALVTLYMAVGAQMGFTAYAMLISLLLFALAGCEWLWLMHSGAKRLIQL